MNTHEMYLNYINYIQNLSDFYVTTTKVDFGNVKIQNDNEEYQIYSIKGSAGIWVYGRVTGLREFIVWDNLSLFQAEYLYTLIIQSDMYKNEMIDKRCD